MTTAIAAEDDLADGHRYMDSHEVAGYLRISFNTLNCWRSRREGPPFVKVGGKVRYRLADVDGWADGRRRDPSSRR